MDFCRIAFLMLGAVLALFGFLLNAFDFAANNSNWLSVNKKGF